MPSLADRLQSLGIKVGTSNLTNLQSHSKLNHPIDRVIPGEWWKTNNGDVFIVETCYDADFRIGQVSLKNQSSLEVISEWAGSSRLAGLSKEQFAFLDVETTGLYGGSGVIAFLIGVARFENDQLRLVQFFLHDPAQEKAQLSALRKFVEPCKAFVSFNGKSFDIPILNARFTLNSLPYPFSEIQHLDLLHLSRRIWKARLPRRTLSDLETHILKAKRTEDDVPSWMTSKLYFEYLETGDARPLRGVFYHNEIDVVSLAALMSHLSNLITNPLEGPETNSLDILAVGKLYAQMGRLKSAVKIYRQGLNRNDLPHDVRWEAVKQLSYIYKKLKDWDSACEQWVNAAHAEEIYAHIELAKYYEHQESSYEHALNWTRRAQKILSKKTGLSHTTNRIDYQQALEHREERLLRRIDRNKL